MIPGADTRGRAGGEGVGARLLRLLVRPADEVAADRRADQRASHVRRGAEGPRVALLVAGPAAARLADAVALALAREVGAGTAVVAAADRVASGDVDEDAAPLARGPARRLAGALRAHGLAATAGQVVRVALPADDALRLAALQRAGVVARSAPVVSLLRPPRTESDEAIVAEQDVAVAVVGREEATAVAALVAADGDRRALRVVGADLEAVARLPAVLAHRSAAARAVVAEVLQALR